MSDNKKYYYLKFKENFFETDDMKILESMPNGYLYSNILMKLYLKSLKRNGLLMFKEAIPYNSEMLATIVNHNVDHVDKAIEVFKELDMIEILDNGAIYMLDIENFIGHSSSEGDRKRLYRKKIESEKIGHLSDIRPPELELELELELDKKPLKKPTKPKTKKKIVNNFKNWTKEEFQEEIKKYGEQYSSDMKNNFYGYWIEPDEYDIMLFQSKKTWGTAGRLSTWYNKSLK